MCGCNPSSFLLGVGGATYQYRTQRNYRTKLHVIQVDLRDKKGRTALTFAAELGHPEVTSWLIKSGADVSARFHQTHGVRGDAKSK